MRAVVQLVKSANVKVNEELISEINKGILVFIGIKTSDTQKDVDYIVKKTLNLRIFHDSEGKMNKNVIDSEGELLVVSQFTLYADCTKGNRPSFIQAMSPVQAQEIFNQVVDSFKAVYPKIKTGKFQAYMQISLINDGPVTILLDS